MRRYVGVRQEENLKWNKMGEGLNDTVKVRKISKH